jgi:hypothetical protein
MVERKKPDNRVRIASGTIKRNRAEQFRADYFYNKSSAMRLKVNLQGRERPRPVREPLSEPDADDEAHRLGLPLECDQRLLPGSRNAWHRCVNRATAHPLDGREQCVFRKQLKWRRGRRHAAERPLGRRIGRFG